MASWRVGEFASRVRSSVVALSLLALPLFGPLLALLALAFQLPLSLPAVFALFALLLGLLVKRSPQHGDDLVVLPL